MNLLFIKVQVNMKVVGHSLMLLGDDAFKPVQQLLGHQRLQRLEEVLESCGNTRVLTHTHTHICADAAPWPECQLAR